MNLPSRVLIQPVTHRHRFITDRSIESKSPRLQWDQLEKFLSSAQSFKDTIESNLEEQGEQRESTKDQSQKLEIAVRKEIGQCRARSKSWNPVLETWKLNRISF